MIVLKRITAENFLAFETAELELDNQGLVLVEGEIKNDSSFDSNGAGKSSLFSLIPWVLWGKILRDTKDVNQVKRKGTNNVRVTLEGEINGQPFTIERARRGNRDSDLSFSLAGTSRVKDVQQEIDRYFGTFELAQNTVLLGQRKAMGFLSAGDKDRKKILEDLLQLGPYSVALEAVRRDLDKYRRDREQNEVARERFKIELRNLELELQNRLSELNSIDETSVQAEIDLLTRDMAESESRVRELGDSYEQLSRKLHVEDLQVNYQNAEKLVGSRKGYLDELQYNLQQLKIGLKRDTDDEEKFRIEGKCPSCGTAVSNDMPHYKELLVKINKAVLAVEDIQKELPRAESSYQSAQKDFQALSLQVSELEIQRRQLDAQLKSEQSSLDTKRARKKIKVLNLEALKEKKKIQSGDIQAEFEKLIAGKKALIEVSEAEVVKLDELIPYLEFWEVGFSHRGLPSLLIEQSLPLLNQYTNEVLEEITDGRFQLTIRAQDETKTRGTVERMAFIVSDWGEEKNLEEYSEGQQRRIIFAMFFALPRVQRTSSGIDWNVRLLDELLDILDRSGVGKVLQYLKKIAHSEIPSIFLISHEQNLDDMWDCKLRVVMEDKIARVINNDRIPAVAN